MSTPYNVIFDKFIKKLHGDKSFFNYKGLSESEINDLVKEHLISLLNTSIDRLYTYGLPDFDFYDKNDTLQTFNGELVNQEVSLLSDLMYLAYFEEDKNKLRALGLVFKTSEINTVFSPANDRKTFLDMVKNIESKSINDINNYFARDRLTWQFKSVYGGN